MVLLEEIVEEEQPETDVSEPFSQVDPHEDLKGQAKSIIDTTESDPSLLPDALQRILVEVIKPLFSASRHPQLTSTGRKNLISAPSQGGRFSYDSIFDESQPWKNTWTAELLQTVLESYNEIPQDDGVQRTTIEAHFHLLIPPILNLIDDTEVAYKVEGCKCLTQLCQLLTRNDSDMMKRTGLTDVFVDVLRKTFTYLPTLTPEDESLDLMQVVYPSFHALVSARFVSISRYIVGDHNGSIAEAETAKGSKDTTDHSVNSMTPAQISAEISARQSLLTLLLRHSILYGLSHLSTGTGHGTSMSVSISTFLLSQVDPICSAMGIYMVAHLQSLQPLVGNILSDPFSTSAPQMLLEAINAEQALIAACWPRVRDRWWTECLSSSVTCWLNILDEMEGLQDDRQKQQLSQVQRALKKIVTMLEEVIENDEFTRAKNDLLAEEASLGGLFNLEGG